MIFKIIKIIICKINKHNFIEIGECPFTNKNYQCCTKCGKVI